MKIRLVQFLSFTFLILWPVITYCCTCGSPIYDDTYYERLIQDSALSIFTGRVKKKEKAADKKEWAITFKVANSWKNAESPELTIYTQDEGCGYGFLKWHRYFVVAKRIGNKLHVSLCSATGTLGASKKHTNSLDKIVARKKVG
jgi:hypothetical protein